MGLSISTLQGWHAVKPTNQPTNQIKFQISFPLLDISLKFKEVVIVVKKTETKECTHLLEMITLFCKKSADIEDIMSFSSFISECSSWLSIVLDDVF